MSDPPVGDYPDGLGTGVEHLMQGETVEIDVWQASYRQLEIRADGNETICEWSGLPAVLMKHIRPNTTTTVRWHDNQQEQTHGT